MLLWTTKACVLCDWYHDLEPAKGYCGYLGQHVDPRWLCIYYEITPQDFPEDDHIIDEILIDEWHTEKGPWEIVGQS